MILFGGGGLPGQRVAPLPFDRYGGYVTVPMERLSQDLGRSIRLILVRMIVAAVVMVAMVGSPRRSLARASP